MTDDLFRPDPNAKVDAQTVKLGALMNALALTMAVNELRKAADAELPPEQSMRGLLRARAAELEELSHQYIATAVHR